MDSSENNAGNKTIRLETPVEKTQRTIRVSSPFPTRIFAKKRELDELLVSRKLSAYTSTALDTSPELEAGLTALDDEYTILEPFAEGGQATIYVARDRNLERVVAVKSLKKDLKNREKIEQSFITEAKVTAQLDHPAIIPIYGLNRDEEFRMIRDRAQKEIFIVGAGMSKLSRLGFDVGLENILTSTIATIRFLLSERPGKTVYPVAVPEVVEEMRAAGVPIVDDDPDIVVLTFDTTITYRKINDAYHFLTSGAELIATHPDDLCPTEDSYDIDIGPFIRMFEQMCQTSAVVIGKPNRLMLEMAARELGVDPADTVMVGDRLYTDIEMAVRAGTQSILVLSGETDMSMVESWGKSPTAIVGSVAEIPKMLDGS